MPGYSKCSVKHWLSSLKPQFLHNLAQSLSKGSFGIVIIPNISQTPLVKVKADSRSVIDRTMRTPPLPCKGVHVLIPRTRDHYLTEQKGLCKQD